MALNFAQFGLDMTVDAPRPSGAVLSLPSGNIAVTEDGQLFSVGQRVVAVGLSPEVFLVATEWMERSIPSRLERELLEYLVAQGMEIIRVEIPYPVACRHGGSIESLRLYWAESFLPDRCRWLFSKPMPLSQKPAIALPLSTIAEDGAVFWRAAGSVADAVFSTKNPSKGLFRAKLARIARVWESRWNTVLAQESEPYDEDPCGWRPRCDEVWARVVRNHLAQYKYEMQPATVARLL